MTNTKAIWLTNTASSNPFFLLWSNVPAGNYTLTAVATDSAGIMATSPAVSIFVVTSLPPMVRIYAPDPVAIEGTNFHNWPPPGGPAGFPGPTNTATFLVWRDGETNSGLTVHFSIAGTASNGVDYAAISDSVTIPAGQRSIRITILPLSDSDSAYRHYDTVILGLRVPSNDTPPPYLLGWPAKAGAVILEENILPILEPMIHGMADDSVHVSLPATNGMNASIQISTDLINWVPVCTNTVLKGSAQFVDPDSTANSNMFYRIVPVAPPPTN